MNRSDFYFALQCAVLRNNRQPVCGIVSSQDSAWFARLFTNTGCDQTASREENKGKGFHTVSLLTKSSHSSRKLLRPPSVRHLWRYSDRSQEADCSPEKPPRLRDQAVRSILAGMSAKYGSLQKRHAELLRLRGRQRRAKWISSQYRYGVGAVRSCVKHDLSWRIPVERHESVPATDTFSRRRPQFPSPFSRLCLKTDQFAITMDW